LATLLPAIFFTTLPVRATTYYVDVTNGNDSWNGTSPTFVSATTGPWKDFKNINFGGAYSPPPPGTTVSVAPGLLDHTGDDTKTAIFLAHVNGTSNSPIVISNNPFGSFIISNSGITTPALEVASSAWVKVFGIAVTNAYRAIVCQGLTNCEFAYCSSGGSNSLNGGPQFNMYNLSQSNWVHNNIFNQGYVSTFGDSTHNMTFGQFFINNGPDITAYNIIESNICIHAGHDTLSCYGPSNVIQFNWVHNGVWYYRSDYMQMSGERDVELGGTIGNYNLMQYNDLDFAGATGTGGAHGIEMSDAAYEVVRYNRFINDAYTGLQIYGGKSTDDTNAPLSLTNAISISNYVYNNTFAYNGFGQRYFTNYTIAGIPNGVSDLWEYKALLGTVNTSSNFYVNNLFYGCYNTNVSANDGWNVDFARWANNLTNVNPLFINTAVPGGEFILTPPDVHLASNSPAIDAGTWLTTITSVDGTGTNFTVFDPNYFFAGLTASSRTISGDTIQLQGATNTAVITAISGNMITVNTSLTWTNGQGLSLPYSGTAPDAGAYEYYMVASPTGLQVVP
jgi:hypothetical protein